MKGGRRRMDTAKGTLIDFSLEDDSLLPSKNISRQGSPEFTENVPSPSSVIAANGLNTELASGHQSSNSDYTNRSIANSPCSIAGGRGQCNATQSPSVSKLKGQQIPGTSPIRIEKSALVNELQENPNNTSCVYNAFLLSLKMVTVLRLSILSLSPVFPDTALSMTFSFNRFWIFSGSMGRVGGTEEDHMDTEPRVENGRKALEDARGNVKARALPPRPMKKMRASRSSHLRKSLAWDKAFSTGEGVLDVDELPFANKPSRKLPDYPVNFPMMPAIAPSTPRSDAPKLTLNHNSSGQGEGNPSSPVQGPIQSDSSLTDSTNSLTSSFKDTPTKSTPSDLVGAKVGKGEITRTVPRNQSIMAAVQKLPMAQIVKGDALKGSRLRLPSRFTGKKEKAKELPKTDDILRRCKSASSVVSAASDNSSLSKKVSSMSRKMKDTLGKVLPGTFGGPARPHKVTGESGDQVLATKAVQTPSRSGAHPADSIANNVSSSASAPITSSKSGRVSAPVTSVEIGTNMKKAAVQAEMSNQEAPNADMSAKGMVGPSLKGSARLKDVGLMGSTHGNAVSSPRKGTGKPSNTNAKASPMFSSRRPPPAPSRVPFSEKVNVGNVSQRNAVSSSGLRLPSPKIGYFDTTKQCSGDQPSKMSQRSRAAPSQSSPKVNSRSTPPKELPSSRAARPAFDNNPFVEASPLARCETSEAPMRLSSDGGHHQLCGVTEPRAVSSESDKPVVENASPPSPVPLVGRQPSPLTTSASKNQAGTGSINRENLQERKTESFVSSASAVVDLDDHPDVYPLAINPGFLNGISQHTSPQPSLRKERNSLSECAMGQENSSVVEGLAVSTNKQRKPSSIQILDQLENTEQSRSGLAGIQFSEDTLRLLEAAGQETLEWKSGAVQHSPPNKKAPLRNPWSPVKRSGQQLGPFDCTKKYANANAIQ